MRETREQPPASWRGLLANWLTSLASSRQPPANWVALSGIWLHRSLIQTLIPIDSGSCREMAIVSRSFDAILSYSQNLHHFSHRDCWQVGLAVLESSAELQGRYPDSVFEIKSNYSIKSTIRVPRLYMLCDKNVFMDFSTSLRIREYWSHTIFTNPIFVRWVLLFWRHISVFFGPTGNLANVGWSFGGDLCWKIPPSNTTSQSLCLFVKCWALIGSSIWPVSEAHLPPAAEQHGVPGPTSYRYKTLVKYNQHIEPHIVLKSMLYNLLLI